MNKINQTIIDLGGITQVGRLIGVDCNVVSNWRARGVPIEWCAEFERISGGRIMRWDLRPHDWRKLWPELRKRKDAPKEVTHV